MSSAKTPLRLRFRLRHMLVLTAICAVGMGFIGLRNRQFRTKAAKVAALWELCQRAGDDFTMRTAAPRQKSYYNSPPLTSRDAIYATERTSWRDWLQGDLSSLDVLCVSLAGREHGGDALREVVRRLAQFPELREIELSSAALSDDDVLALVQSCPNLIRLKLASPLVTDASLSHIAELRQLQELDLYSTEVAGEGIGQVFAACPDLWDLTLWELNLTSGAIDQIKQWQTAQGLALRTFDNAALSVTDPERF